jgi:transposase-like protein
MVIHKISVPYYHQSNGRVERINRTIREACKKTKGSLKRKLVKIVENYNNLVHRGVGMTPAEALKEENINKVKEWSNKYKQEFKTKKKINKLEINDHVLIRNEVRRSKMDDEFEKRGIVKRILDNDIYEVSVVNKKLKNENIRRHISQLCRI